MGGDPNFPIDVTRAFNDVAAEFRTWGRYQLVDAPAQADLVFQLRDVAPISGVYGTDGNVASTTSPAFQLTVVDPKLNIPLYTVTSPVQISGNRKVREHWVSVSETNLVSRVKVLASQSLSPEESAELTSAPKYHNARTFWIAGGAIVAAGVAGGLILHHEFENSLANQKASQDAFCAANNIPLSMCAGG